MYTTLLRKLRSPYFRKLCLVFVVWVIVVTGMSYFAANDMILGRASNNSPSTQQPELLRNLAHWDGGWYQNIAANGYHMDTTPTGEPQLDMPAFFPLYPLLMRAANTVFHNLVISGYLLNVLFSFGAFVFLFLLARDFLKDSSKALRAVLLFAVFPTAFFMLAIYTEALFCFLSFGAFYFARQRKWLFANVLLALCTATRSPGIVVALGVFIEYLHSREFNWRKLDRHIFTFVLAPLGFLAYAFFLQRRFGDALAMLHAEKYWGQGLNADIPMTIGHQVVGVLRNIILPGYNSHGLAQPGEWTNLLTLVLWGLPILGVLYAWIAKRKLPPAYSVYVLVMLFYLISKGNFVSVARYVLPIFPLYLLLVRATEKHEEWYLLSVVVFAVCMSFGLTEFVNSVWAG